jgi:hypothetical protein
MSKVSEIMKMKLTGVKSTQPAVITNTTTGTSFDGVVDVAWDNLTVADAIKRATSNVVIAIAPSVRKNIGDYRSKKTISVSAPKPGRRERATAVITDSDATEHIATSMDRDTALALINAEFDRRANA